MTKRHAPTDIQTPDQRAQRNLTRAAPSRRRLYTEAEVREFLRMSRTTFKRRKGALPWAQEVLPRVGRPLYLAAPLDRYLAGLWPSHAPEFGRARPRRTTTTVNPPKGTGNADDPANT